MSILETSHCRVCFKESFSAWERQKQRNPNPDLHCRLYLSILMAERKQSPVFHQATPWWSRFRMWIAIPQHPMALGYRTPSCSTLQSTLGWMKLLLSSCLTVGSCACSVGKTGKRPYSSVTNRWSIAISPVRTMRGRVFLYRT